MNTLKLRLLTNWNIMRVVRLLIGLYLLISAVQMHDWLVGTLSLLFVLMAVSNTGCCGAQGCSVPYKGPQNNTDELNK
jgi:hypothetical protein